MAASNFNLYLMRSKTRAIFFTQQINYWLLSEFSKSMLRETYSTVLEWFYKWLFGPF